MPDGAQSRPVYWDACNFLSYINGIPERLPVLDALLDQASRKGGTALITSVISITEVAFGLAEQTKHALDPTIEARIDALWADRQAVILVDCHELIARRARGLERLALQQNWALKPFDAIHLATAEWVNAAEVQTYDKKLFKFHAMIGRQIREPFTPQPRLTP